MGDNGPPYTNKSGSREGIKARRIIHIARHSPSMAAFKACIFRGGGRGALTPSSSLWQVRFSPRYS